MSDLIHPSLFLICPPDTIPRGSGILVDPGAIVLRFQQAWLPFLSRATRGHADVDCFLIVSG